MTSVTPTDNRLTFARERVDARRSLEGEDAAVPLRVGVDQPQQADGVPLLFTVHPAVSSCTVQAPGAGGRYRCIDMALWEGGDCV